MSWDYENKLPSKGFTSHLIYHCSPKKVELRIGNQFLINLAIQVEGSPISKALICIKMYKSKQKWQFCQGN